MQTTTKTPIANKSIIITDNICTKCRQCGKPWNTKLQRRKKGIASSTKTKAHVHFQLCSIIIQSFVRRYLIQRHIARKDPIEEWNRRCCVHYLTIKGPYASRNHFARFHRIICTAAASEIQKVWRHYLCLRYLENLPFAAKEKNSTVIQRTWRASWCRRSFRIVCRAIKTHEEHFYSLVDEYDTIDMSRNVQFCLFGCPLAIKYKHQNRKVWQEVDNNNIRSFIRRQLLAQYKRRRNSHRRRTTALHSTPRKRSIAEVKREKIRKMSQKKWKWFYDRQNDDCENSASLQPEYIANASSDTEVMTWLTNLDLNEYA